MDQSNSQKSPCADPPLDENMYVVDKILKKRTIIKNGKHQILYYVRWEGYPDPADHTWEPLENLRSVPQMVEDFEKRLADKQKRDQLEQDRKREERKREDKFEVNHNNLDFRKLQNSANESQDPPHKHLKIKEELSNLTFDRKRPSNDIKDVPRFTSELCSKKERDKQIHKNERSDHNAIVKDKLEVKEKRLQVPLARDEKREELRYGRVVNHIYRDGELCYQIECISKDKVKRVQQISSKKASGECLANAFQYLQKLVTNLEENLEK